MSNSFQPATFVDDRVDPLGVSRFVGIWLIAIGALAASGVPIASHDSYGNPIWLVASFVAGGLCGFAVAQLQRHPTRQRVWLPAAALLLVAGSCLAYVGYPLAAAFVLAVALTLVLVVTRPLRNVRGVIETAAAVAFAVILAGQVFQQDAMSWWYRVIAALSAVTFLVVLWLDRRPVGEALGECIFRIMYRMRVSGPGVAELPRSGPLLVIANHCSYLDPCWIMICLPRDLTPLMYAAYFKLPGLHFYMKYIINAIPAGAPKIRKVAPELDEVVHRLDRGEGVLIFPEGWVRRNADEEIRRFAQGPWRILTERPTTPVLACWIEGGWGSWSSFANGSPFQLNRLDFRQPIDIGVSAPVVLDTETLSDRERAREILKQMVLGARAYVAARGSATTAHP